MLRIFLTGDNHIGLKYANYTQGEQLSQYRLDTLRDMVKTANSLECDIFAIAGDLFHSRRGLGKQIVTEVANILADFEEQVVVLPGNHDYYTGHLENGESKDVWDYFEAAISTKENILLLTEYRPYDLCLRDEHIVIYPAFCQTKHSNPGENNLGWIREQDIQPDQTYRIGMAHGAIEGQTIDCEGSYFLMSQQELDAIPVDIWLVGHTHVPFPNLDPDTYREAGRIFNAGTHVQTDISCNTEGNGFVIEIESGNSQKRVRAKRYISGPVRFYRKEIHVTAGTSLSDALACELESLGNNSVVDVVLAGSVSEEDYQARQQIVNEALSRFLDTKYFDDTALTPIITEERIKREYPETSFSAQLLFKLLDNPKEAQLVYDLLKKCQ